MMTAEEERRRLAYDRAVRRAEEKVAAKAAQAEADRAERERAYVLNAEEERRQELLALNNLLTESPQSAKHRGVESYRPYPTHQGGPF